MATALFRADASPEMGGGHVMRSLALAHALSGRGWDCAFASVPGTEAAVPALGKSKFPVHETKEDPSDAAGLARTTGGVDLLVVDHYGLDRAFEAASRGWAARIAVIDDLANRPHDADFLVDPTLGRGEGDYRGLVPEGCRVFLGPGYAPLRPEFADLGRSRDPDGTPAGRVFVGFGLLDSADATGWVLEAFSDKAPGFALDVVLGTGAPHLDRVRALVDSLPGGGTLHVEPENPAAVMAAADIAIGASGSTSWERCALGLPSVVLVVADNQESIARALAEKGAAGLLGRVGEITPKSLREAVSALLEDPERRSAMTRAGRQICDGRGAERIAEALSA